MGLASDLFSEIIKSKKNNNPSGIVSICSSNTFVIKAFFKSAQNKKDKIFLIESTSNQVNQYGGYTGMKPDDFMNYVISIAKEYKVVKNQIILGGDHLGPNPFKHIEKQKAMEEACILVSECVKAGYKKIHLDASMPLKGDSLNKNMGLHPEIAAERAAILCKAAEDSINKKYIDKDFEKPVYVIGTEVPAPGGSDEVENKVKITTPEDLKLTIELTKKAFIKHGLEDAWERVIGVVCQPGVEFGDRYILDYNREEAKNLIKYLKSIDYLTGEAHSTDYQTRKKLKELVEDGFGILKVGPALTFAFREAIFALSFIEAELIKNKEKRSNLIEVLKNVMLKNPVWWKSHYKDSSDISFKYSLFDRIRYYWNNPEVEESLKILFKNLRNIEIPYSLLSQFLPNQYVKIRNNILNPDPLDIVLDKINYVIQDYYYATMKFV